MLSTDFFNQSLNSTLIEALMVSTSNYEMRDSLFLGIDASFNLKFRIADYGEPYDWEHMRDSYPFNGFTDTEATAISAAMSLWTGPERIFM